MWKKGQFDLLVYLFIIFYGKESTSDYIYYAGYGSGSAFHDTHQTTRGDGSPTGIAIRRSSQSPQHISGSGEHISPRGLTSGPRDNKVESSAGTSRSSGHGQQLTGDVLSEMSRAGIALRRLSARSSGGAPGKGFNQVSNSCVFLVTSNKFCVD